MIIDSQTKRDLSKFEKFKVIYSFLWYLRCTIFSYIELSIPSISLSFIVIVSIINLVTRSKVDLFQLDFINIVCKKRLRRIFKKKKKKKIKSCVICYLLSPRQFCFYYAQLKLKCDSLIPFWYIFLPYLRRTQMTQSADAENSDRPKSIPRWPTTPWPSFQLNPFAVKDDKEQSKQHSFCFF